MSKQPLRALIVDDEALIRQLTSRALSGEGFCCDLAADGNEAQRKLRSNRYDLVVTDLRMPNRHGHSLASDLVLQPNRPLVVVLTALADPRMTKDLLTRGVDDVVLKPVNYPSFAAKLRALVNRREVAASRELPVAESQAAEDGKSRDVSKKPSASPEAVVEVPIPAAEFDSQLAKVTDLLPLSQSTLDVSLLAQSRGCSALRLAAAIQTDATLSVEILRLANSSYSNPGSSRIVELVEAIPRIGYRRIGELTLSMHAARLLNIGAIPWMDCDLALRRTLAAGLATDLLVTQGKHAAIQSGLFLAASMHGFGRVALALLFAQRYATMVASCRENNESLSEREARAFPISHTAAMARILQAWSVPPEVYKPLRFLLDDFNVVARLAEPTRSKIELVKLAVFLGWIAAGPWESWDQVEFVPASVFKRLRITDPAAILRAIREGMTSLAANIAPPATPSEEILEPIAKPIREIRYCTLSNEPYDPLAELFDGMSMTATSAPRGVGAAGKAVLLNCLETLPDKISTYSATEKSQKSIMVGYGDQFDQKASNGKIVRLPTSYANLRCACEQAAV